MNNKKFFESFMFRRYSFDKGHHTDNFTNGGLSSNYVGYLIKGRAKFVSKYGSFLLKEKDFFYIPKDCPYHSYWYTNADSQLEWYSLGFDYMPLSDNSNFILQKFEADALAEEAFDKLTKNLKVNIENIGLFYLFLGKVCPQMKKDCRANIALTEKAMEYMQNNTNAKMSEVAKHCNISEATLYTLFKKHFRKTPNDIRQKILCDKAEELLSTTSLSVEEISERLGFSSASYFRKILRRHLNVTPKEIRKNYGI